VVAGRRRVVDEVERLILLDQVEGRAGGGAAGRGGDEQRRRDRSRADEPADGEGKSLPDVRRPLLRITNYRASR
jgi:hypothetical protein